MNEECPIALNELLDSVGISKGDFAKLMKVNRKTVTRWLDKNETTHEMLTVIDKYKADMTQEQSESVPVPVACMAVSESKNLAHGILPVTHRNIALSRTWHHLDNIEVARRFNLSRFDYNKSAQDTVAYCQLKDTSFIELRE